MSRFDTIFGRAAGVIRSHLGKPTGVVRLARGIATARLDVPGARFEEDLATATRYVRESGFVEDDNGLRNVRLGLLDIPAEYETDDRDKWEIDGEVWSAVGQPVGRDVAFRTVVVKRTEGVSTTKPRIRGAR